GQSVQLGVNVDPANGVTGPYAYSWTPDSNLVSATVQNPTATPTKAGTHTYSVTVTAGDDCSNADPVQVSVIVNELPIVSADANDKDICLGESINLSSNVTTTAAGTPTYTWTPGTGLDDATISNPVSTPPTAGPITYELKVVDGNGCSNPDGSATVTIQVNDLPTVTVDANDKDICLGASARSGAH